MLHARVVDNALILLDGDGAGGVDNDATRRRVRVAAVDRGQQQLLLQV